jgi:hypothetical protein
MIDIRQGDRRAAFEAPFNVYPCDSLYVSPMCSGRSPCPDER